MTVCVRRVEITKINDITLGTVTVNYNGTEYADIPVHIHTDYGTRRRNIIEEILVDDPNTDENELKGYYERSTLLWVLGKGAKFRKWSKLTKKWDFYNEYIAEKAEALCLFKESSDKITAMFVVSVINHIGAAIASFYHPDMWGINPVKGWPTWRPYGALTTTTTIDSIVTVKAYIFDLITGEVALIPNADYTGLIKADTGVTLEDYDHFMTYAILPLPGVYEHPYRAFEGARFPDIDNIQWEYESQYYPELLWDWSHISDESITGGVIYHYVDHLDNVKGTLDRTVILNYPLSPYYDHTEESWDITLDKWNPVYPTVRTLLYGKSEFQNDPTWSDIHGSMYGQYYDGITPEALPTDRMEVAISIEGNQQGHMYLGTYSHDFSCVYTRTLSNGQITSFPFEYHSTRTYDPPDAVSPIEESIETTQLEYISTNHLIMRYNLLYNFRFSILTAFRAPITKTYTTAAGWSSVYGDKIPMFMADTITSDSTYPNENLEPLVDFCRKKFNDVIDGTPFTSIDGVTFDLEIFFVPYDLREAGLK